FQNGRLGSRPHYEAVRPTFRRRSRSERRRDHAREMECSRAHALARTVRVARLEAWAPFGRGVPGLWPDAPPTIAPRANPDGTCTAHRSTHRGGPRGGSEKARRTPDPDR